MQFRVCARKRVIFLERGVTLRSFNMFVGLSKTSWTSTIQPGNIPKIGLLFYYAVIPLTGRRTGRRLSLQSCVPPLIGQPDNAKVLPSTDLQNLERNSGSTVPLPKGPKKRGISEGNSFITNSSSFTHTVQLVSHHKEDE